MIKAIFRAVFILLLIIGAGVALWFHPIITVIVLVAGWLALMIYLDPPSKWN